MSEYLLDGGAGETDLKILPRGDLEGEGGLDDDAGLPGGGAGAAACHKEVRSVIWRAGGGSRVAARR